MSGKKVSDESHQSLSIHKNQYHHQIPCLNLHKKIPHLDSVDTMFERFHLTKPAESHPIPFVKANNIANKVLNGIETSNALVTKKILYLQARNTVLKNVSRAYKRNGTCKSRINSMKDILTDSLEGNVEIPKELYILASFLERDPDPDFIGSENWYYSNCLLVKNFRGVPYILSPRGKYNHTLGILPLHLHASSKEWSSNDDQMHISSVDGSLQPILQVGASKKGYICVRKKSSISILKLSRTNAQDIPSTIPVTIIHSNTYPFTSINIHKAEFIVSNTQRELRLYKVKSRTPMLQGTVARSEECTYTHSWNAVAYWKGNPTVAMFADACAISAVDLKSPNLNIIDRWCPRPLLESCERISFLAQSDFSTDLWYVGTSHHVLALDTRRSGLKAFKFRVTHHMSAVPMFCAIKCLDDREILVLGDQACNQMRSLQVLWGSGAPFVSAYANYVNTPLDTLHQARLRGELLSCGLSKRFDNNLLGLSFIPSSPATNTNHARRSLTLLSLRSSGDIFTQDMNQEPLYSTDYPSTAAEIPSTQKLRCSADEESDGSLEHYTQTPVTKLPQRKLRAENSALKTEEGTQDSDLEGSETGLCKQETLEELNEGGYLGVGNWLNEDEPCLDVGDLNAMLASCGARTVETNGPASQDLFDDTAPSPMINEHTRSQPEGSRSQPEGSRSESLSDRDLEVLRKWTRDLNAENLERKMPLRGAVECVFTDLFDPTPCQPPADDPQPSIPTQPDTHRTLASALLDLRNCGLNTNILKCKDKVFESITCWSDDTSDEERIDCRFETPDGNRSDAESILEEVQETVEADTLRDLYVESDSDESNPEARVALLVQREREMAASAQKLADPLTYLRSHRGRKLRSTGKPQTRRMSQGNEENVGGMNTPKSSRTKRKGSR